MKVGTIIYATNSGLGILAKDFYDNGVITDVLVQTHPHLKNNFHWYKDSPALSVISNIAMNSKKTEKHNEDLIESFINKVDVLLLFEIEWYSDIIQKARKLGKKVILMPMYECSPFPILADCYLTVSDLDHEYYTKMYNGRNIKRINVPANSNLKWKKREKANVFIHNSGFHNSNDRNGTQKIIDSLPLIKSKDIEIRIRTQNLKYKFPSDSRLTIDSSDRNFDELWNDGDVFIFPERWNGLSLPIQEAYSSGLLIMCGDRNPMNNWLPKKPMIKVNHYERMNIVPRIPFPAACYNPEDIAKKIDEFAGQDISEYSLMGKQWSEENSWENLKSEYIKIIKSVYES